MPMQQQQEMMCFMGSGAVDRSTRGAGSLPATQVNTNATPHTPTHTHTHTDIDTPTSTHPHVPTAAAASVPTHLQAVVAVDAGDGVEVDGPERALVELVLDRRLRREPLPLLLGLERRDLLGEGLEDLV